MRVMFMCVRNACRSQMAEGYARTLSGGKWEVWSSGLERTEVHPLAVRVMAEDGVDISRQTSKVVDPKLLNQMDLVVTLCGEAGDICPATPSHVKRQHWPLEDPSQFEGSEEEILRQFRAVRDEIKRRVEALIRSMETEGAGP